ncbi:MAG: HeparIIIIIN domain-containing protein [Nitrospira sp.]|nr:MAG: HeparIIIIIN domain-containing protein [Nitrospira sp.]
MKRFLLYLRTLAHLRPAQVLSLIAKRVLPSLHLRRRSHTFSLRAGTELDACCPHSRQPAKDDSFYFLHQEKIFPNGLMDWRSKDMPKLWRYNLHYFDYLHDTGRSLDSKSALISSWIDHNPPGTEDAWEPYTVSLRIVNWIKFFIQVDHRVIQQGWLQSLGEQARWLEGNLESHLLANHYLKNGVAIFFAGMYFEGADADRWVKKGRRILSSELEEQFLPDGGHFERSPMYHSISVLDYLDVLNLMHSSRANIPFTEIDRFTLRMNQALEFLDDICLPDKEIPLFNDSALGIAPPPPDILAYGSHITGYELRPPPCDLTVTPKPDTGYYVLRDGTDMMIIDCGAVGPDYQPGHAHADTLSFELALNGHRIVVDSGVFDYEPSARRTHVRSTPAHNTLCIDGEDQSETWGVFRVARRARPLQARLTCDGQGHAKFEGAHDGYLRLPGCLIHARTIHYSAPGIWSVEDTVEGKGIHSIKSYLHIHPAYTLERMGQAAEIRDGSQLLILTITVAPNVEIQIEQGAYFPEFGKELPNFTMVMAYYGPVPVTLTYHITKNI